MIVLGVDEAGYGPNLGPLVIAATAWDVPDGTEQNLWPLFGGTVCRQPDPSGSRVHIADSKQVHASTAGIGAVERSATTLLRLYGERPGTLFELWDGLAERSIRLSCGEPWFLLDDLPLPLGGLTTECESLALRWRGEAAAADCRPVALAVSILPAQPFNAAVSREGSKGRCLSLATLQLIRRVWDGATPALILCDKHGGRDRYGTLLTEAFAGLLPRPLRESRQGSEYRLGPAELRFLPRAEEHLPVAAASLVAKYTREAAMAALNRYWSRRLPELRATAGYPTDALRFLAEIETELRAAGIPRETFWRCR